MPRVRVRRFMSMTPVIGVEGQAAAGGGGPAGGDERDERGDLAANEREGVAVVAGEVDRDQDDSATSMAFAM